MDASIYDFTPRDLQGQPYPLAQHRGKVLLLVNTASACGFTRQLEGLQQLHARYADQGLVVIGAPCNQFGAQEPGTAGEIASFCQRNYGVDFPLLEKLEVNGRSAHPLYQWLTREKPGLLGTRGIKWNFTKFLVGRDGRVLERFGPQQKPEALASAIEAALRSAVA